MKVGKRQLVLASLVLALGAAVYLNWTLSDGIPLTTTGETATSSDALEEKLVNANLTNETETGAESGLEAEQANTSGGEDASVEAAKTFSEARMARQQSRDEAIELLESVLQDVEADEETKKEAIEQAAEIAQNILQETNIENLIKAKGCTDCTVYLEDEQCTAVVSSDFTQADHLVVIRDIIVDQTGLSADAIKVVPAAG